MNYKKVLPAVALTLGVTAQLAAHAELFQMTEVSAHGLLAAASAPDSKCGAGSCGAAKANEKKEAAEHKCGAKKGEHMCGNRKDKKKCNASAKKAEHKCASATCGASAKTEKH